ncbi:uncharacterized protein FOMMEDRAFT_90501 [Fomitiporia mediterranea MF3/22]|uniref:uncharacterized protein n=1 Tax=Fomitiporia mediterranea (strain MF3/22) TaxID=694068 RepID=UPI00044087EA|nr:uncharacterized protein FOMMEDRAFT_90501 [Fomitiporia mediterranea MF3/22]EJD01644.1 hypothetical protein FOMMEDRAFT_90501 [Fomitiporia mediterranea MF3/22]
MKLNCSPPPLRLILSNVSINRHRKHSIGFLGQRTFFGVPSLSSFSPFSNEQGNGNGNGHEQTYHERKILPYSQKQLYELVADVDNYRHFVPYCTESKVLTSRLVNPHASQNEGKVEKKEARLTVGFLAFKESYVSEVTCRPYLSVEAVASSGTPLFKRLVTTWRFQPADSSSPHLTHAGVSSHSSAGSPSSDSPANGPTLLSIDLGFAFSNPIYAAASSAFFKQVSSMMVQAFERRCVEVYGHGRK